MLQMTCQSRFPFLGKERAPGEVLREELQDALANGRTTMTAVTALKNRHLAILQDDEAKAADGELVERFSKLETVVHEIATQLGIDIAAAESGEPRNPSALARRTEE